MAQVILGIHGLGNKPPKGVLEQWWRLAMEEGLKTIGRKPRLPRFEIVYWADILYEAPLDPYIGDPGDPLHIDEPYQPAPVLLRPTTGRFRTRIIGLLGWALRRLSLRADFSLRYPRISETIVSRYFEDLDAYYREPEPDSASIDADVKGKILSRVRSVLDDWKKHEIFLVGHSMGAIIAFDVLTFHAPQLQVHTLATIGSPLGMPNVLSKIAEQSREPGDTSIALRTPPGVGAAWKNFSDTNDLIALNSTLAESYDANDLGVEPEDHVVFNNYCVRNRRNPHKVYGYLRTPEFAAALASFVDARPTLRQRVSGAIRRMLAGLGIGRRRRRA